MNHMILNDVSYDFSTLEIFQPDADYHVNEKDLELSMKKNRELIEESKRYLEKLGMSDENMENQN